MKQTKSPNSPSATNPDRPGALVIAHPGHELLVYEWLRRTRPHVFILTDGSGHTGRSRLASTTKILEQVGATPESPYGRFTDQAMYAAILDQHLDELFGLAEELAEAFIRLRVDYVAGDAVEGYNPTHDLCRLIIDTALRIVNRRSRRAVANFDFPLAVRPDASPAALRPEAIRLQLDDEAFDRKSAVARGYPEMAGEISAALRENGVEAFRVECLRPVEPGSGNDSPFRGPPYYEQYGERQVAAGYYGRVIRYREHIAPIARALWKHVGEHS